MENFILQMLLISDVKLIFSYDTTRNVQIIMCNHYKS